MSKKGLDLARDNSLHRLKVNPKGAVVWVIRDGEVIVRAQ
jgi:hypothetical protein